MHASATPNDADAGPKCSWCNYDLRATTSGICPECGGEPIDPRILARLATVSKRWVCVGLAIAAVSTAGMFWIRTPYYPLPAQFHLVGVVVLTCVICLGPMLIFQQRAKHLRAVQRIIWLRCSFWLLSPSLFTSIAVFSVFQWFKYRTRDMQPGNYQITVEFRNALILGELSLPVVLCVGIAVWWLRWHTLRTLAGLRKGDRVAQVLAAIASIVVSTLWASFIVGFATMDD
jgi:hypothetical protein